MTDIKTFYKNKRVFITGHTGFKGVWLSKWLLNLGANVTGFALPPENEQKEVYLKADLTNIRSVLGDIRYFKRLKQVFDEANPEIVFHLAAQPLVLKAYQNPVETYETNVMGTVNILECIRLNENVKSFVNVTTDKVYQNKEWYWGYRETDILDGRDPYSNSKSCSELVTHSYKESFFDDGRCAVSTARAGNVIGGGDFNEHRIIPDCIRAAYKNEIITVRNPLSVRPYQFVLEPLYAYLLLAAAQYENPKLGGGYNIGPKDSDIITTGELADIFCKAWGEGVSWQSANKDLLQKANNKTGKEANILKLDSSKIKCALNWKPVYSIKDAVKNTVFWAKAWQNGANMSDITNGQIREFMEDLKNDER